jgi:aminomethyltransferase
MKSTPLTPVHEALGAKMVEFAGYAMPIQYSGIKDEHQAVREAVGLFDVSHMGEFIFKGPEAPALMQRVTSNNIHRLQPGQAQYSCLPNAHGGIVDDLIVYRLEDGNWMLVVNAANIEKDWKWIERFNMTDVEAHNVSDKTALLALQGPKAVDVLEAVTDEDVDVEGLKFYTFMKATVAGCDNVLISATGYTGSGGYELYCENRHAEALWNALMEAGAEFGIKPCGLAARDTLRLEMGYCLYGNDIDDTTNPLEAGLGWITKLKAEDNDFVGKEEILERKEAGVTRKLVGFVLQERGIPRKDCPIENASGERIGTVTSGTMGPTVGKAIGLGYVATEHAEPGSSIHIRIRNKTVEAN